MDYLRGGEGRISSEVNTVFTCGFWKKFYLRCFRNYKEKALRNLKQSRRRQWKVKLMGGVKNLNLEFYRHLILSKYYFGWALIVVATYKNGW